MFSKNQSYLKFQHFCVSETMCPDVQMGFCMETTGMTQGGQGEAHTDLESDLKDEAESMEDEQDPEVCIVHSLLLTFIDNVFIYLTSCPTSIVWANDCGDKISEVKK